MLTAPVEKFRAAIQEDIGVDIGSENAANFLDQKWLQQHGSPYPTDVVPKEWHSGAARFLCRRNVVCLAKELADAAGEPLPRGRLALTATDRLLYEFWPRSPGN
jgi:hypothetical protein